jgi:hypothetical protein
MYICTVCGFDGLKYPPADHVICPSCGTQFGLDDEGPFSKDEAHLRLRNRWISNGAKWYSKVLPEPAQWNPYNQMMVAGLYRRESNLAS